MKASTLRRPPAPLTATVAMLGLVASAGLNVIGLAPTVMAAGVKGSPQANVIALVITVVFGVAPALIAVWSLNRGYVWAPIGVTVAILWGAALVVGTSPVVSWVSLAIALIATFAAWLPSSRRFARELRDFRVSKP